MIAPGGQAWYAPAVLRSWPLALVLAAAASPAQADEPVAWIGIGFDAASGPEVVINEVYPGTGAARAGLLPGDLIVAIDGSPLVGPRDLSARVRLHGVGDRLRLAVVRDGEADTRVTTVRLGLRPTTSELVEARLVGTTLPGGAMVDPRGAPVPLAAGPQVLVVFDAHCERCGPVADTLATAIADDGMNVPVRAVMAGTADAVAQYLRRVPVMVPIARIPDDDGAAVGRWLLSGALVSDEGVVLVVDGKHQVQFAASTADGPAITAAALAAAARCDHGRGRRR